MPSPELSHQLYGAAEALCTSALHQDAYNLVSPAADHTSALVIAGRANPGSEPTYTIVDVSSATLAADRPHVFAVFEERPHGPRVSSGGVLLPDRATTLTERAILLADDYMALLLEKAIEVTPFSLPPPDARMYFTLLAGAVRRITRLEG